MLIGPRMRDGEQGYEVITPLERQGDGTTILVNRGWIAKRFADQKTRPESLVRDEVTVEGLLREPWKKNMFTPNNRPDKWEFYFPDVKQMAALVNSQPIWVEATLGVCCNHSPMSLTIFFLSTANPNINTVPEYLLLADYQARGIPIGRPPVVNIRNNHAQYIFTWYHTPTFPIFLNAVKLTIPSRYGLCLATSIMLYMVAKKPSSEIAKRVRMSKNW